MQTRYLSALSGIACLLAMAACGGGGDDGGNGGGGGAPDTPIVIANYQVTFSPEQVIGGPAVPDAVTATANLSTDAGEDIFARGSVTIADAAATAVTINVGYAGENGAVAVALTDSGGGRWDVPAGTELDISELRRLDTTGYYVSIDSPAGELRGQIRPANWAVGVVDLDAASVVGGSTSTGTAKGGFGFNPRTGQLHIRVTIDGVASVTGAGIRNAIAGARGDVAVPLEASLADARVWGTRDINNPDAGDVLTLTGLDLLAGGALYLSVESVANMDGALRGQIVDDSIEIFATDLTSSEVVTGGAPVDTTALGNATVTWVDSLARLGVATSNDAANVLSISVHQGEPGENGPAIYSLTPNSAMPGNWVLEPTSLDAAQAAAFAAGNLYVSVATNAYPNGELRAQLTADGVQQITFTVNEAMTEAQEIGEDGGTLTLDVPGGALINVEFPEFALDGQTEIVAQPVTSVQGLPEGLTAVTAVKLGPSGTDFGFEPTVTFDLRSLQAPDGVVVAYLVDDDGFGARLLFLNGVEPTANSLSDGPFTAVVPHFSYVTIAVADPNAVDAGLIEVDKQSDIEVEVLNKINQQIAKERARDKLGQNSDIRDIGSWAEPELERWLKKLDERGANLPGSATIPQIVQVINEAIRLLKAYDTLGSLRDGLPPDFGSGLDQMTARLKEVLDGQLKTLKGACLDDDTSSINAIQSILVFAERLQVRTNDGFLDKDDVLDLKEAARCFDFRVTPDRIVGFLPFNAEFRAELFREDGPAPGFSPADVNFVWSLPDSGFSQDNPLTLPVTEPGPAVVVGLIPGLDSEDASVFGIPNYLGPWQGSAKGGATGCSDPEDDGTGSVGFTLQISGQEILQESPTVKIRLSGSYSSETLVISVFSIELELAYAGLGRIDGTLASGIALFTVTETYEDENGEMVTVQTDGVINFTPGTIALLSDGTFKIAGTGSDMSGCQLSGTVELKR